MEVTLPAFLAAAIVLAVAGAWRRNVAAVVGAVAAIALGTVWHLSSAAPGTPILTLGIGEYIVLIVIGVVVAASRFMGERSQAELQPMDVGDGTERLSVSTRPDGGARRRGAGMGAGAALVLVAVVSWVLVANRADDVAPLPGAEVLVEVAPSKAQLEDLQPVGEVFIDRISDVRVRVNYLMTAHPWCFKHAGIDVVETTADVTLTVRIGRLSDPEADAVFESVAGDDADEVRCVTVGERVLEHRWAEVELDQPLGDRSIYTGG